MTRYRKIDVGIHNDAKFRRMSDKAKLLWFTILTCPELTSLGCMKFTEAGFAEEMGWTLQAFREAFREVLGQGMVKHCSEAKFLCIPRFLKYNPPESINVVKSWSKFEPLLPECSLRTEHIQEVKGILEGISDAFLEAFPHEFEIHNLFPEPGTLNPEPGTLNPEEPPLPPSGGNNGISVQKIAQLWNDRAPHALSRLRLPFARGERALKRITAAIKRHPEKEWWEELIDILGERPFLLGVNDRGWRATFDFVVEHAEEIMDGKYAGTKAQGQTAERAAGPMAWLAEREAKREREG